jgi:hypothetical protein
MTEIVDDEPASKTVLQTKGGWHRRTLLASTFIAAALDMLAINDSGGTTLSAGAQSPASTPSPAPQSSPGGPAPKLTGIRVTQRYPIGGTAKFLAWVAYFDPIGGIGPFTWRLQDPTGKYRLYGDTVATSENAVVGLGKDKLTVSVVDGRGDTCAPVTFEVAKAEGNGIGLNTRNPLPAFSPIVRGAVRPDIAPSFTPVAYGPAHADTRGDALAVTNEDGTPSAQWTPAYGSIHSKTGQHPEPGSYKLRMGRTNPASGDTQWLNETLVITSAPTTVDQIEFIQTGTLSTATVAGTVIGKAAATVPDNNPVFALNDPSGTLTVDTAAREIRVLKQPAATGDVPFTLEVSSGGGALTGSAKFSARVVQGTVLDPAAMSLALNKLDNSTPGQKVGRLAVKGHSGGAWRITGQSGYNPSATAGQWGNPARYQVDATGQIYTPPDCLLSFQDPACNWQDDEITALWTSADGTTTCQRNFTVHVSEPATTTTIYVGKGLAAKYGIFGLDSLHAANLLSSRYHPGIKYWFKVQHDPDPDAYTDATRGNDTKGGWVGPTVVELVPGPNGQLPRLGGKADNTGANTGITSYGKGYFIASHGDIRLMGAGKISAVHGGGSTDGKEAIRKDGNTWGNLSIFGITVEDCDQAIEAGVCHGYIYARDIAVRRCGGASVGAGLTHGFYIGSVSKFEMVDSYVDGTPWGHLVKSRARQTTLRRNRIYDTGAAACCIDLPNGGDVLLENNHFRKGPFATNPAVINFGAEGPAWAVNQLVLDRNTIAAGGMSYGGNYGPIVAVAHYHLPGTAPSAVSGAGNSIWLPPFGQVSMDLSDYARPGSTALAGTNILPVPPRMDPLPAPTTRPYRHRMILDSAGEFRNFNGLAQLPDKLNLEMSAPGPVCTIVAVGDIMGGVDPFAEGATTWAIIADGVYNHRGNPNPWAPPDAFTITTRPDGRGVLAYAGGLTPGGYFVQLRASNRGSEISDARYFVTVAPGA